MEIISIKIDIEDGVVGAVTENFDYATISTSRDTFEEVVDTMILLITDELLLNSVEDDYDLEFVYRVKLRM